MENEKNPTTTIQSEREAECIKYRNTKEKIMSGIQITELIPDGLINKLADEIIQKESKRNIQKSSIIIKNPELTEIFLADIKQSIKPIIEHTIIQLENAILNHQENIIQLETDLLYLSEKKSDQKQSNAFQNKLIEIYNYYSQLNDLHLEKTHSISETSTNPCQDHPNFREDSIHHLQPDSLSNTENLLNNPIKITERFKRREELDSIPNRKQAGTEDPPPSVCQGLTGFDLLYCKWKNR